MKNTLLLAFVFGAVVFTSIQAKEEVAKLRASQKVSTDSYNNTADVYNKSTILNILEDKNLRE